MITTRWLGILVGLFGLIFSFNRFRHGRVRREDFAWVSLASLALLVVAAYPTSVGVLREMLFLRDAQFARLIALAIASNMALWAFVLLIRLRSSAQADEFDLLVRKLGVAEFAREHQGLAALPPIAVVIPAYDEEENIGAVLGSIPAEIAGRGVAAIVVDDGSRDRTMDAAREAGALVVSNPINRGGGAALRLGFDIARGLGATIVVTMDADGQHLPEEIPGLVTPIFHDEADIVIGSRVLGRREKDSTVRYIGIHVFNVVIRLLTHVRVTDCSSGFRAFHVDVLSRLLLRQNQFHTAELIIDAAKRRVRIKEVPVTIRRRLSGQSKKGRNWRYGLAFLRTVVQTWWR